MRLGALASTTVALAACGNTPMPEGDITEKIHEPENIQYSVLPVPIFTCGAQGICTTNIILMPHVITDDEDWIFRLKDCKTNTESNKQECRTEGVYVSKEVYDSYNVGDRYSASSANEASDPDHKRQK